MCLCRNGNLSRLAVDERGRSCDCCCPPAVTANGDSKRPKGSLLRRIKSMLAKRPLTQRTIDSLKVTGERFFVHDALVPGFAVRMTEGGYRSFVLIARFPGSSNSTARSIGTVGKVSLEWARAKAREWQQSIAEG